MAEFDSVIPPGGVGKVVASVDSTKFKGPVTKTVTVHANDPNNPRVSLRLKAEILVPIDVRPRDRVSFAGKPGALEPQEVFVVAMDGKPFNVKAIDKQNEAISVALEPAPDQAVPMADGTKPEAGKTPEGYVAGGYAAYKATVSVASTVAVGRLLDTVRLETDHPKAGSVDIRVLGNVTGNVVVRPSSLYFLGSPDEDGTRSSEVRLIKRPEGGLAVKSIRTDNPDFVASLAPVEEGKEYKVTVKHVGASTGTTIAAKLFVETNDPLQPTIEVKLVAR